MARRRRRQSRFAHQNRLARKYALGVITAATDHAVSGAATHDGGGSSTNDVAASTGRTAICHGTPRLRGELHVVETADGNGSIRTKCRTGARSNPGWPASDERIRQKITFFILAAREIHVIAIHSSL